MAFPQQELSNHSLIKSCECHTDLFSWGNEGSYLNICITKCRNLKGTIAHVSQAGNSNCAVLISII